MGCWCLLCSEHESHIISPEVTGRDEAQIIYCLLRRSSRRKQSRKPASYCTMNIQITWCKNTSDYDMFLWVNGDGAHTVLSKNQPAIMKAKFWYEMFSYMKKKWFKWSNFIFVLQFNTLPRTMFNLWGEKSPEYIFCSEHKAKMEISRNSMYLCSIKSQAKKDQCAHWIGQVWLVLCDRATWILYLLFEDVNQTKNARGTKTSLTKPPCRSLSTSL